MVRLNEDILDSPYKQGDVGFVVHIVASVRGYVLEMADYDNVDDFLLDVDETQIQLVPESERDQVFVKPFDIREYLDIVHPGAVLQHDFLTPHKLTPYRVAKEIGISQTQVNEILEGKLSINPDTALRLAKYFGNTPEFWLHLQTSHDLSIARRTFDESTIEPYSA